MKKIAIDFDGVITMPFNNSELGIDEFRYLKSELSILLSVPRVGTFQILSALHFYSDLYIVTARPERHKKAILEWLKINNFSPFFSEVICLENTSKIEFIHSEKFELLIDDKEFNIDISSNKFLLWTNQDYTDILKNSFLNLSFSKAFFRYESSFILDNVELKSELGSSPVFIISYTNLTKHKLRVCDNLDTFNRINNILFFSKSNNLQFTQEKIATSGLSILKSYIEGRGIDELNDKERIQSIANVAETLIKFHSISNGKFSLCSADNFNIIIKENGEIYFIDLEAVIQETYIVDLIWAEYFLCKNEEECNLLFDKYLLICKERPTIKDVELAHNIFLTWINYLLLKSINRNILFSEKTNKTSKILTEINQKEKQLQLTRVLQNWGGRK
jgi:hypothetical protein